MKIKLVERGFESFTGFLGDIEFAEGVSVENLFKSQVDRISGSIRVKDVDGNNVGVAQDLLDRHGDKAEVVTPLQTQEAINQEAAEVAKGEAELSELLTTASDAAPTTQNEAVSNEHPAVLAHTQESLSAVADEKGIQGLREIADTFGVKGNAIAKLIEDILAAQAVKSAQEAKPE